MAVNVRYNINSNTIRVGYGIYVTMTIIVQLFHHDKVLISDE